MKTNKFMMAFAVIAVASMSSCTQEEELVALDSQFSDNAVAFGTYIGKNPASRGSLMTTKTLAASEDGFGVMAYYTKTANFGNTSKPDFMYNQQVLGTSGVWTYDPLKYWPNNTDEKISFFAYAPYVSTAEFGATGIIGLSANTDPGDPTLTFKMSDNVSEHIDLLYADAAATGVNQIKNLTKPAADTKVIFNFKHALSRIDFKRVVLIDEDDTKKLDENTTITINKVTFSPMGFGTQGTLNLNTGEWSDVSYTTTSYELGPDDFADGSNVLTNANATVEAPLTGSNSSIMFIPVTQTSEGADKNGEITIDYTVKTIDGNLSEGASVITNSRTVPFKIAFQQGKVYTLVLKIGMTSVKLDATVSDWGSEDQIIEI